MNNINININDKMKDIFFDGFKADSFVARGLWYERVDLFKYRWLADVLFSASMKKERVENVHGVYIPIHIDLNAPLANLCVEEVYKETDFYFYKWKTEYYWLDEIKKTNARVFVKGCGLIKK